MYFASSLPKRACVLERASLKMATWRADYARQSSSSEEDMCSSCFANTKYTCLKCQIPICNKCSTFEENEASDRWTAGKCVAYCEPCFKEKLLEHSDGGKKPGKKEQQEKLDDQDITKEQEKYVLKLLF